MPQGLSRLRWLVAVGPLPPVVLAFLVAGALLHIVWRAPAVADTVWLIGLIVTGVPVVWHTLRGMLHGRFAADVVAMLAVITAVLLNEPLAGLIVVLMQTGGEALERYAGHRASDAVRELEEAAPRTAHLLEDGTVHDVASETVRVGQCVLVRPGELVPCDGVVESGRSHVDTARLTGEPLPVRAEPGVELMSGSVNGESPLEVRVTRISQESQYARIVELVRTAQASKAPLQRLADRYAVWFTPLTLLVCAVAWLASGEAIRVLAVLVVATPCPLILATPVAIIGGINRAARNRIVVRHGGALEQLADITAVVLDKTGTLTVGLPRVDRVIPAPGYSVEQVLELAGAVERGSSHLLARTLVDAAEEAGIRPGTATDVREAPGQGVAGVVTGHRIAVGTRRFALDGADAGDDAFDRFAGSADGLRAFVTVDGEPAGVVVYEDKVRENAAALLNDLASLGLHRIVLLSGDHSRNAIAVAKTLGIADVRGDQLPQDKVDAVNELLAAGERVVMVGDGTNDAPALSAATVGIALAGHGGGITAEAADVVLLVDDPLRVAHAIRVGRRTMRIARESLRIGLGLSALAMVFAALGYIPPTLGALLQEAIDVGVIVNALRSTTAGRSASGPAPEPAPVSAA